MIESLLFTTLLKVVYWDGKYSFILHEGKMEEGMAHYHGLTWDYRGTVYVAGCDDFRYVIRRFLWPEMSELSPLADDLHETHQIFWYDGILYVANTGKNRVDVWQDGRWQSVAWNPSPCDVDHINGIWAAKEFVYITEHRQKVEGGSIIRMCDRHLLHLLGHQPIGPNIHNVYQEGKDLYTLTSPDKGLPAAILKIDVTGHIQRVDFPEWGKCMLRGLARTKDFWYFGMSRWEPEPSKRNIGDAIIVQLDDNFHETDRLVFPDFGPVCDVRVIGAQDYAHNGIVLEVR